MRNKIMNAYVYTAFSGPIHVKCLARVYDRLFNVNRIECEVIEEHSAYHKGDIMNIPERDIYKSFKPYPSNTGNGRYKGRLDFMSLPYKVIF